MDMKKYVVAAIAALALICGCDRSASVYPETQRQWYYELMTVTNRTDAPVVLFVAEKSSVPASGEAGGLPATLSQREKDSALTIPAKSTTEIYIEENGSKDILEEYGVEDRVFFYIFDKTVFEGTEWSKIVEESLWLAKYSFTPNELISCGKKITYSAAE